MIQKVLLPFFFCLSVFLSTAQDTTSAQVFNVKKTEQKPVPLGWVGIDSCLTEQLYSISTDRVRWDSISVYKIQYKMMPALNGEREYLLWKSEEGVGYVVIWSRTPGGDYKQTYVKPIYFYNPPKVVTKNSK